MGFFVCKITYTYLIKFFILIEILRIETIKIVHPALILVATAGKLFLERGSSKSILVILNIKIIAAIMVIIYVVNFMSE